MRLDHSIPLPLSEASVRARMEVRDLPDPKSADGKRLEATLNEFEALLLEQMLKEMRHTVPESSIFGQNRGQEIFNEMLDGEYARLMEQRGGIGLARFMYERMAES